MEQPTDKDNEAVETLPAAGAVGDAGPSPTAGAASAGDLVSVSIAELEELRRKARERDQIWDRLLRATADHDNWRKRIERDTQNNLRFALREFLRELLPILDNLDRAIQSGEKDHQVASLLEGVELAQKQMHELLRAKGVVPVPTVGTKFDPGSHEAVAAIPSAEHPPSTVIQELSKGFKMHEQVIRPARVVVASGPPQQAAGDKDK